MTYTGRGSLLVAAGAIAVLAGLLVSFPAHLALAWFAPPALRAWGVDGTVWRGHATELALDGRSLGAASWHARPARMLLLQPTWDLELRRPDGHARARLAFSLFRDRQQFTNLDASLALETLPPTIVPVGVAGHVQIALQKLEIVQGWPTSIVGRAHVANLDLPGVILTLGPFDFSFPDQAGPPAAEIRSRGGPLDLDGRVELPDRGQWHFDAELAPGENPPQELVDGLAFIGEDLGGGRRRLVLSSEP